MQTLNKHKEDIQEYISQILLKKIPANKYEQFALNRHIEDIKISKSDEDYPYYFEQEAGERVIKFIELLKHSKGKWAGDFLKLEPWQKFLISVLFGWKKKSNNMRRFNKAYIEIARKNAKTTLAAAIGLYMLIADNEGGAEVFSVATKTDQAKISWNIAKSMVQSNQTLKNQISVFQKTLVSGSSVFTPLSSDDKSEDGHSPHFALVDEYHQHSSDGMLNSMTTGMGSRSQPITMIITTAGFDKNAVCFTERERAIRILENISQDENYFTMIFTLDENDDFADKNVWRKANPNLGVSLFEEYLERQVSEALDSPTKTNAVLTKNFNIWTQSYTRWINYSKWEDNITPYEYSSLQGRDCYGGLDLSTTTDITAFILDFPPEKQGEKHKKIYRFFIPEEGMLDRERKDKVPYSTWIEQGFVIATPGNVIDYSFVESEILDLASKYNIREIAFDPYNSTEIVSHLMNEGLELVEFRQGFVSMNPACKEYERLILKNEFAINDNPVMNWMISNVEVNTDPAGNIKPRKPRRDLSSKRIDGVVADIMATYRSVVLENSRKSIYETRGVRAI